VPTNLRSGEVDAVFAAEADCARALARTESEPGYKSPAATISGSSLTNTCPLRNALKN
jgi:hypothetical protein